MANPEHLAKLQEAVDKKDIEIWNKWRHTQENPIVDLSKVELRGADLRGINLRQAILWEGDLSGANLQGANLEDAVLFEANLSGSILQSKLARATMAQTDLQYAFFVSADLADANVIDSLIGNTVFADTDLSTVNRLDEVFHTSPSTIGIDTLYKSGGNIPEIFLRGCGVPETMITFARSLVGKPIQYYSAFISYSSQDEMFARRLHNDLQMNGVRVWFAPEDLKTGDPLKHTIDESIRLYDKLIIVLSEDSIHSAWVRHEFAGALSKERQHNKLVLFPIRLDDAVFETTEQWAFDLKERKIGDFRDWTNPLKYQAAFNRLLKDLNATS